jgi:hypothetical protein
MSSRQTTDPSLDDILRQMPEAFAKKDVGLVAKHLHKDFHRAIYPRSLGKPNQTGEEWLREMAEMISYLDGDFKVSYASLR